MKWDEDNQRLINAVTEWLDSLNKIVRGGVTYYDIKGVHKYLTQREALKHFLDNIYNNK